LASVCQKFAAFFGKLELFVSTIFVTHNAAEWVTDCLRTGKPSRYMTNHPVQLSLPSLRGRWIKYRPVWLGLWRRTFTCVGWQVTLCDLVWQVMLRSSEIGFL